VSRKKERCTHKTRISKLLVTVHDQPFPIHNSRSTIHYSLFTELFSTDKVLLPPEVTALSADKTNPSAEERFLSPDKMRLLRQEKPLSPNEMMMFENKTRFLVNRISSFTDKITMSQANCS